MLERLKKSSIDWIVVFLGNPGRKYYRTRHNAGFMTADVCESELGLRINKSRFHALTAQARINGSSVLLMKPQTFMNLSGVAVSEAAKFYKVAPERILVVSDDITLAVGKLRIRTKGSAGGHNGLKDIISRLGTQEFPRIKIGVGIPVGEQPDIIDWVLDTFKNQDAEDIDAATKRAWMACAAYISEGADRAMNLYNQ